MMILILVVIFTWSINLTNCVGLVTFVILTIDTVAVCDADNDIIINFIIQRCSSTFLYLRFLLVWALVLMADFILEFRFEYLWPFWLLLRSVYDSFKYQGLVCSVVCVFGLLLHYSLNFKKCFVGLLVLGDGHFSRWAWGLPVEHCAGIFSSLYSQSAQLWMTALLLFVLVLGKIDIQYIGVSIG